MQARHRQVRDSVTGQYAFDGDFARMCTCGHTLGVHAAGGFDCLAGTGVLDDPSPGTTCECRKFRQSRRAGRRNDAGDAR
jgi:hypothetical protein